MKRRIAKLEKKMFKLANIARDEAKKLKEAKLALQKGKEEAKHEAEKVASKLEKDDKRKLKEEAAKTK